MFRDRIRNKSTTDGFVATSRSQTITHTCDLRAEDSEGTMASSTILDTIASTPGYDYLPKDQVPVVIEKARSITPVDEKNHQELETGNSVSLSYNDHQFSGDHARRVINHGHRRSSRGLIAEFKDRVTKRSPVIVEDVAIQVNELLDVNMLSDI